MKSMRMMRVRSAGPLISKLRNKELARNKSNVSSIISGCDGSAGNDCVNIPGKLGMTDTLHRLVLVLEFWS